MDTLHVLSIFSSAMAMIKDTLWIPYSVKKQVAKEKGYFLNSMASFQHSSFFVSILSLYLSTT